MNSLGKFQIQSNENSQYWQAMPGQDYSAVVLQAGTNSNSWFEIMSLSETSNQVAFKSAVSDAGQATYVSARQGDWYGKLQLQAPNSADWITAVSGDETYALVYVSTTQVIIELVSPSAYVTALMNTPDPRANNGASISVKDNISLFSGNQTGGNLITAPTADSQFTLIPEDDTAAANLKTFLARGVS